ncbi:hypothetical protein [Agitococcus lubricus]|uniref:Uncharacterized protein n=1 Tax=Agitococcus lubricus TaxID=1077255 RepID=A0A2T5IN90_9GAMM|nr:hypothetical protein [Agitococcus lubricus]PTQ85288.1 hypothetical protein C8N29_1531 [Agitococcus lubricus]
MRKIAYIAIFTICSHAIAFDGHNGISFDMTQKQVEAKGFVCHPPQEKNPSVIAECQHTNMTGVAFGFPTKDYQISIGPTKKVDMIGADFSGRISKKDYVGLFRKIEQLFPKKDETGTFHEGTVLRDVWRANNNAAVILLLMNGVPPITESSLGITFWSPRAMAEADKNNK